MDKKIFIFIGLSILTILIGLPLTLKQNWKQFSDIDVSRRPLIDTLNRATVFNGHEDISLQQIIIDSIYVMFRFPPQTCLCLEPDLSEAVNNMGKSIGEDRIFVIITAENIKDIFYFRERTKLTCPVYATTDTLLSSFDTRHLPYACIVFPDMSVQNIVSIHPNNISELISYVKKTIR